MGELINGRTPEEIKRVLEWANCACGSLDCEECQYYGSVCSSENFERIAPDALALIQHLEAQKSKWISVKERLPEEKESVLVHYVDGWMPTAFLLDGKWYQSNGEMSWLSVTHWMPMPQPPEEEE